MTQWKRHALRLVLAFLVGIAGLFLYRVSRFRVPSATDATDARESLERLRAACSKLSGKTCYWSPTANGPILSIYGVTEEAERQEVEGAARRVLPRTDGTRVVLKF